MSTTNEPKCGCGADAKWMATVKATGPVGTREEVVPLCDACMQRGTMALVEAASDIEVDGEL